MPADPRFWANSVVPIATIGRIRAFLTHASKMGRAGRGFRGRFIMPSDTPIELKPLAQRHRALLETLARYMDAAQAHQATPRAIPLGTGTSDDLRPVVAALRAIASDCHRLETMLGSAAGLPIDPEPAGTARRTQKPLPLPDGPQPPCEFWWEGRSWELQPVPYRVLCVLWPSFDRWVTCERILDQVWRAHGLDGNAGALETARKKANSAMREIRCWRKIRIKGGMIILEPQIRFPA
jgi:hypothetical protein